MEPWVIALIVIGCLLFLFIVAELIAGNYFYKVAFDRRLTTAKGTRKPFVSPDGKQTLRYDWDWIKKTHFEEVGISSFDETLLKAELALNPNGGHKYIISCHGYRGEWEELSLPAHQFYEKLGYSILMINERGHDKSGYPLITFGDKECRDLVEWVKYLVYRDKDAQICLYGLSMGAATVMMSLNLGLPSNVKCAIEDCGFSSIKEQFKHVLKTQFKIPPFLILPVCQFVCIFRHQISMTKHSAIKALKEDEIPIMMIHGTGDTYVPYRMLDENFQAVREGTYKEKLPVEGAWHAMSCSVDFDEYIKKTSDFLARFIS
ncbi:MAG: alpha/beta hydrolase [Bacilli bacterium]|jgi:fermentation-respiration switch protein FrsA (DUF1100 family)|nr:alpha/beta hydrolase [Bacilli bacterium]